MSIASRYNSTMANLISGHVKSILKDWNCTGERDNIDLNSIAYSFPQNISYKSYLLGRGNIKNPLGAVAGGGPVLAEELLFYLRIQFANGLLFEIICEQESPLFFKIYCNEKEIGHLKRCLCSADTPLSRTRKWNVFRNNNLYGTIERSTMVKSNNLFLKRINGESLLISLARKSRVKDLLKLFPVFGFFLGKHNNDFVLSEVNMNKLLPEDKILFFPICVFMRTLVFELEFGWC